ncbi:DNA-directed RNA polymerase III RPC9 [Besnoitia besnoiti]|uniref:DNA-directed RNA polymerase III subunit RPC9 n=1 Tax=Besnoitia besnoiti TaxID=94643 RepID=A0A2A9M9Q3_BESBE|nr:DNA-directed RNA polymerase III RPC9 [Besnoitia besnoiti]PFH32656.1 DNA-directed RNA polymerase III RPC9 [Besnoitia besnoiti]
MHVADPCAGVLTNLEVLALLRQQQRRLPSLQSLLLNHSSSSNTHAARESAPGDREGVSGATSAARADPAASDAPSVLRPEAVKTYLHQHMLNYTLQEYIQATCPYLSLLDTGPPQRLSSDKSPRGQRPRPGAGVQQKKPARAGDDKSHLQPGAEGPAGGRLSRSGSAAGGVAAPGATRGLQKLLGRRFFTCVGPCLEVLSLRYGLYQGELLQLLNLGASRPVEIYAMVEECAVRLSENDVNEILSVIQHYLVDHKTNPLPYALPVPAASRQASNPASPPLSYAYATGMLGSSGASAAAASSAPSANADGDDCEMEDSADSSAARSLGPDVGAHGASHAQSAFSAAASLSPRLLAATTGRGACEAPRSSLSGEPRTFLDALADSSEGSARLVSTSDYWDGAEAAPGADGEGEEREPQRGRKASKRASSSGRASRTRATRGSRKRGVSAGEAERAP